MALHSLQRLIGASGQGGSAGQTFVNNVKPFGAKAGAAMTQYVLTEWGSWTNTYTGGTLSYGATITLTYQLTAGSRWSNIRQALRAIANDGTDPGNTGHADIVSGSIPVPGSNTVQLQVYGGTKIVQLHRVFGGINKDWADYPNGEPNPNPIDVESDILITAQFSSTGDTSPSSYTYTLHVNYPGDGDFNAALDFSFPVTVMGNVTTDDTAASVEWHSNSSYTALYDTSVQTRVQSGGSYPTSGSLWMRYKDNGAWVNYGQVDWYDKRAYGHF